MTTRKKIMKTHSSFYVSQNSAKKRFSSTFVCLAASIGLMVCGTFVLFQLSASHDDAKMNSFADKNAARGSNQTETSSDYQRAKKHFSASTPRQSIESLRAAFLAAQNTKCPIEQNKAFENCLNGLSPQDAADILSSMSLEELNGVASQRLFQLWTNANPQEALKWALGLELCDIRNALMNMAATRWASQDLQSAENWVSNFPEGESRTELVNAMIQGVISLSPTDALRIAGELLPESVATNKLIIQASGEWAVLDRDSAAAWARNITDISLRQEVMETMATLLINQDLRAAVDIALNDMASGEQQDRVLASVVQSWAQKEPAVVASWVRQFPDDRLGQEAAETLINYWVVSDPKASGEWLSSLAPSKLRNMGVIAYARVLRRTDIAMADRWEAKLLSDL